jgi:hypothetical protein
MNGSIKDSTQAYIFDVMSSEAKVRLPSMTVVINPAQCSATETRLSPKRCLHNGAIQYRKAASSVMVMFVLEEARPDSRSQ